METQDFEQVLILDRNEIGRVLGTVKQRLSRAKRAVYISGNDCKFVVESLSAEISSTLARGVQVKILAVEPNSDTSRMLSLIDPRFETAQKFIDSMQSVKMELQHIKNQYPENFEYRFLPVLPAMGFFITDPQSVDGIVKVEIYTAKPWTPKETRPHLIIPYNLYEWRNYFVSQWENYWNLAQNTTELPQVKSHRYAPNKMKVLFLAANPMNTVRVRLDEESRTIDRSLRQSEFRETFEIKQHWAVRIIDIQGFLLRYQPDIVHFSGHGSNANEIILEDVQGKGQPVSVHALSQLFGVLKDNIKCVILNACYSEEQALAIAEHIDCVIGMSGKIGDQAAISFSTAFYQALGYGRDIKTAFDLGCIQIDMESLDEKDVPKLIALKSKPEKITFVTA